MVYPAIILIGRVRRALRQGAVIIDISGDADTVPGAVAIPENLVALNVERLRQLRKPIIVCGRSALSNFRAVRFLRQKGLEVYNGGNRGLVSRAKRLTRIE